MVIAGVIGIVATTASDSDDAPVETYEHNVMKSTLTSGACFAQPQHPTAVETVDVVSCDSRHEGEVYETRDLATSDDAPYPGEAAVARSADALCRERFRWVVGVPADESELKRTDIHPSQTSWEAQEDRLVVCIVSDPSGTSTESLSGAAR